MKRVFFNNKLAFSVLFKCGETIVILQRIFSEQKVLLFKFYFKDQRCEDVLMNSMMDHPSSQESAIVVTILMIIVITVHDNHHHI